MIMDVVWVKWSSYGGREDTWSCCQNVLGEVPRNTPMTSQNGEESAGACAEV